MTTRQVLEAARSLISNPDSWCQNTYKRGNKRCLARAIRDACPAGFAGAYEALVAQLPQEYEARTLAVFNDSHTHQEVLGLLDRAIGAAA